MINRIKIDNFGPFQEFEWENLSNINIIVGNNDTGKSYLLKILYSSVKSIEDLSKQQKTQKVTWRDLLSEKLLWTFHAFQKDSWELGRLVNKKAASSLTAHIRFSDENYSFSINKDATKHISHASDPGDLSEIKPIIFIPPKEILTVLEAIAVTREVLEIPHFDDTYYDLVKLLRVPTSKGNVQQSLKGCMKDLEQLINGEIKLQEENFKFKRGRETYEMAETAEGFKKIGIFTTLIRNRTLQPDAIIFIDELENNLHPRAIRIFIDMIQKMSETGSKERIQFFLTTHNYFVIKYFELIARKFKRDISFCSLSRDQDGSCKAEIKNLKDGIPSNAIVKESVTLFEDEINL